MAEEKLSLTGDRMAKEAADPDQRFVELLRAVARPEIESVVLGLVGAELYRLALESWDDARDYAEVLARREEARRDG